MSAGFEFLARLFSTAKAQHHQQNVPRIERSEIVGKYMAVQIERVLINVRAKNSWTKERLSVCAVQLQYGNLWDWPMDVTTFAKFRFIDNAGFTYEVMRDSTDWHLLDFMCEDGAPLSMPPPHADLEAHARTRGWRLFPALPLGAVPERFIFTFSRYSPGRLDGIVEETETLELAVASADLRPIVAATPRLKPRSQRRISDQ